MAKRIVVNPGDSIDRIGYSHGVAPKTLWHLSDNEDLSSLRNNPNILMNGDTVVIPDKKQKNLPAITGRRHRFRRVGVPSKLRVQLLENGEPRSNCFYRLKAGALLESGLTDNEGLIEHWVSPDIDTALLEIDHGEIYELHIGRLNPATDITGVESRLQNLGYLSEIETPAPQTPLTTAIAAFQRDSSLTETGEIDFETRSILERRHRC